MMKRLLILVILMSVITGCEQPAAEVPAKTNAPMKVKTIAVKRADMRETRSFFGSVKLRREAFLASQFDGRLADFTLLPGNKVKTGQNVATIIPALREALLQSLDGSQQKINNELKQQMQSISLISPISGEILSVIRHSGDVLQRGDHIAQIADLSVLDVQVDLPVQYSMVVNDNAKLDVTFVGFPNIMLHLPVEALVGQANEENQTIPLRLRLDNARGMYRPGMIAKVELLIASHSKALVVPRQALIEEEGVFSVFTLTDQKVKKRLVQPGIFSDELVEILSGVSENERVVTEKSYSLVDGMEVQE